MYPHLRPYLRALGLLLPVLFGAGLSAASAADTRYYVNSIGMEFARIPEGMFMMGSDREHDKDAADDELPRHKVTITRAFYLGKYEVTQAQWEAVMGANPSRHKAGKNPVENVSWEDAREFIRRLNQKEKTDRYRLPTEAEWEYAARAGSKTSWFFGNDAGQLDRYAWYDENWRTGSTYPVGGKKPNAWGLYDMEGNVWEWVNDWYDSDYYAQSPAVDPQGPSSGIYRVNRGGRWANIAKYCRSAFRYANTPGHRSNDLGFRLAASHDPSLPAAGKTAEAGKTADRE